MKFNILTLFPEMFPGPFRHSISGNALKKKIFSIETTNIRDFSGSKHRTVDDKPFGGGAGMIIKPDVLQNAFNSVKKNLKSKTIKSIYLTPKGQPLKQKTIKNLCEYKELIIICGRYEGIDQRFLDKNEIDEISIGDYIISGGEFASFILIDACIRLIPEVLGNEESLNYESFENFLLEYPQYTKPSVWDNCSVPDVLLSGDHKKIAEWREKKAIEITKNTRPDLWNLYKNTESRKK